MTSPLAPELLESIRTTIAIARTKAQQSVNFIMVEAYWQVGQLIVENEQQGDLRAAYGTALIQTLSDRLTEEFGKGFSKRNLHSMVKFYQTFPIVQTLSAQLSWSHYLLLLKVEDATAKKKSEL